MRPGEPALLRNVFRGRVAAALPCVVVEDVDERVVLWLRVGTPIAWIGATPLPAWIDAGHPVVLKVWDDNDRLFIWPRGRSHHVSFLREAATGNDVCFYVDAAEAWVSTSLGWDTCDQELDVVAWPDLSAWWWKDETEYAERIDRGLLASARAAELRTELEEVIADLEARRGIWAEASSWRAWRPDPAWPVPCLPHGWDVL